MEFRSLRVQGFLGFNVSGFKVLGFWEWSFGQAFRFPALGYGVSGLTLRSQGFINEIETGIIQGFVGNPRSQRALSSP